MTDLEIDSHRTRGGYLRKGGRLNKGGDNHPGTRNLPVTPGKGKGECVREAGKRGMGVHRALVAGEQDTHGGQPKPAPVALTDWAEKHDVGLEYIQAGKSHRTRLSRQFNHTCRKKTSNICTYDHLAEVI